MRLSAQPSMTQACGGSASKRSWKTPWYWKPSRICAPRINVRVSSSAVFTLSCSDMASVTFLSQDAGAERNQGYFVPFILPQRIEYDPVPAGRLARHERH